MGHYAPRRARPGEQFVFNHHGNVKVELTADDEGIVDPKTALEDEVADLMFLPIAEDIVSARKAAAAAAAEVKATKADKPKNGPATAPTNTREA